jgi:exonuclease III
MRITAHNCRGLGNGPAVRGLLDLQKQVDPDVLFLSETKMDENRMKWIKSVLGMSNMVVRECDGRSGGLALLWKRHINVELHNFSRYHIDVKITEQDGYKWRFTGIYGEPATDKRERTWKLLRILNQQLKLPWLCAGDFNEILYGHEKKGGPPRNHKHMEDFRMVLADCGLRDLGFSGDKFTWRNNSHEANRYIKERLDRAVGSREWCARFPAYKVINGDQRHSDHRPITILVEGTQKLPRSGNGRNSFRFEAKWLEEEDCEAIVNNA